MSQVTSLSLSFLNCKGKELPPYKGLGTLSELTMQST